MKKNQNKYNFIIRVYGLFIENENVLISDEYQLNTKMTKFPGGGLEYGEGPVDCIKRECLEEFGQEIEVINHYYTTDFFQKALFFNTSQLISIYYEVKFKDDIKFKISTQPFDFKELKNGAQSFRWVDINTFHEEELSFPIDRFVLKNLKQNITFIKK